MEMADFKLGDLVWAQMKSYPPWPARVSEPPENIAKEKKGHHCVKFFGTSDHAWIPDDKICIHSEKMLEAMAFKKKTKLLKKAIDQIVDESRKTPKIDRPVLVEKEKTNSVIEKEPEVVKKRKVLKVETILHKTSVKKPSKKRSSEKINSDRSARARHRKAFQITDKSKSSYEHKESHSSISTTLLKKNSYVERPPTPTLDLKTIRESLRAKNITPNHMKIGFLGLNPVGRGIVKNLLNSGHNVTIWNQTPIYREFIENGAKVAKTPADVIEACDVTFCCVSDPQETKKLVFENCGVLKGLECCPPLTKGYIELTAIDPKTSQDIAKEICCKGGRYVEAPVTGSREEAEEGSLVVVVAGDQDLFKDCQSCFSSFTKTAYFVGLNIGYACKISVALNMFRGSVIAALAEALTLISRSQLSIESFLSILDMTPIDLRMFMQKGRGMDRRNYTADISLATQQKDMMLALDFADSLKQPLILAGAANEIYKRAKLRCYAEHDVSSVIEGIKY